MRKLMTTTSSLFNSPVVRYAATFGITLLCASANANAALASAGAVSFVRGIQGMSDQVQLAAWPVTLIGATVAGMALWRSHGNWSELGHGATNIVGVGGLTLGAASLLSLVPRVQGALI